MCVLGIQILVPTFVGQVLYGVKPTPQSFFIIPILQVNPYTVIPRTRRSSGSKGAGAGALWRQGYNHLPKVTVFYCSITNGDAETVFFPCGAKS